MADCIIDIGHRDGSEPARWVSRTHPSMTVCDRHADQYATAYDAETRITDWERIPVTDSQDGEG